jgi:hypothetical protein
VRTQDDLLNLPASPLVVKKELRLSMRKTFVPESNIMNVKYLAVFLSDLSQIGSNGENVFTTDLTKTALDNRSDASQHGLIQTPNRFVPLRTTKSELAVRLRNPPILSSPGVSALLMPSVSKLNGLTIFVLDMTILKLALATSDGPITQCGLSASQSAFLMIANTSVPELDPDPEKIFADVCPTSLSQFHAVLRLNLLPRLTLPKPPFSRLCIITTIANGMLFLSQNGQLALQLVTVQMPLVWVSRQFQDDLSVQTNGRTSLSPSLAQSFVKINARLLYGISGRHAHLTAS